MPDWKRPKTRIVSLAPSSTSILCEIGARPLLVGVTNWCCDVAPVAGLPQVGDCWHMESVADMNRQTKVASALASGVEMTQQTQVTADGRSLKVSLAPIFQSVSASDVGVNLPTVPGGR